MVEPFCGFVFFFFNLTAGEPNEKTVKDVRDGLVEFEEFLLVKNFLVAYDPVPEP